MEATGSEFNPKRAALGSWRTRRSDGFSPGALMVMKCSKGQGASEYLMVFAAVLLISMIAVVLMGYFTSFSTDAAITSSNTYWRSEARPFAILEHTGTAANGTYYLRIENAEGRETLNITNIALENVSAVGSTAGVTSVAFLPGESRIMILNGGKTGTSGAIYELDVNITYIRKNGIPAVQYGTKKLVGRYQ